MSTHSFTSITANYLPKARVLANSIKQHNPGLHFHLVLCDTVPTELRLEDEPFDSIIQIDELPIPNSKAWIFKHTLVELCTAVKGYGFLEIIQRHDAQKVFYFDPDIIVLNELSTLVDKLDHASVLLTPHQTEPEETLEAIIDNEICSLKHGAYNLGFLGVNNSNNGIKFLQWWCDRLHRFCYDDKARGLFTDQKWVDLALSYFDDIHIAREPQYNVATWNLTHRRATGSLKGGIFINQQPLVFFHFSGLDSGDQKIMLKKYIGDSLVLNDLRSWYLKECEKMGQSELGRIPFSYGRYDNGKEISKHERLLYRHRDDLQARFPAPYDTKDVDSSYYHWYRAHVPENEREIGGPNDTPEAIKSALFECRAELNAIKESKSWKLIKVLHRIYRAFGF